MEDVDIRCTLPSTTGVWDTSNPLGLHYESLGGCLMCGSAHKQKYVCLLLRRDSD